MTLECVAASVISTNFPTQIGKFPLWPAREIDPPNFQIFVKNPRKNNALWGLGGVKFHWGTKLSKVENCQHKCELVDNHSQQLLFYPNQATCDMIFAHARRRHRRAPSGRQWVNCKSPEMAFGRAPHPVRKAVKVASS